MPATPGKGAFTIASSFFLVIGLVMEQRSHSQETCAPAIEWQRSFGGTGSDAFAVIAETTARGFALGGSSDSPPTGNKTALNFGLEDFWLVRIDGLGNKLWDRSYGGSASEGITGLLQTSDGGFIVTGWSLSAPSGNKTSPHYGYADYWVVRLTRDGNILWDRSYGGGGEDRPASIIQTLDGGFLVGGYSYSLPSGNKTASSYGRRDYWVVRLDSNGNKLWDSSYGGSHDDNLARIRQAADGYFFAGSSGSAAGTGKSSANYGGTDFWLVRTDASGNRLWDSAVGGANFDNLNAMAQAKGEGLFLAGTTFVVGNSPGDFRMEDFWVVRMDDWGNTLWDISFGGSEREFCWEALPMKDGGVTLVGDQEVGFDSDGWIIRLDPLGNKLWEKRIGTPWIDVFVGATVAADGGLVLSGWSLSTPPHAFNSPGSGNSDYWVVKMQPETADCDGDGVVDGRDQCPNTAPGATVNEHGCSIVQLCPCDAPWPNHAQYVHCVAEAARDFYRHQRITAELRHDLIRMAKRSDCGSN